MADVLPATMLESGSQALAAYATTALFDRHPIAESAFQPQAFERWRAFFSETIGDLSAALRLGEPELFATSMIWRRRGFEARELDAAFILQAVHALDATLSARLAEQAMISIRQYLDIAIRAVERNQERSADRLSPGSSSERLALQYLQTILEGDRRNATDLILGSYEHDPDLVGMYSRVLLPALREVGIMWHLGELSVAEEHFVTDTTKHVMSILLHRTAPADPIGRTLISAGITGNAHDIPVRVVADFFEVAGWSVVNLGSDLPAGDIARAAAFFSADLVALSATLANQLPAMQHTIQTIRTLEPAREVKIIVGGMAFVPSPEIWRKLGADAYVEDAATAPELALTLFDDAN